MSTGEKGWRTAEDGGDFSIVLGGPLYQLYLRTRLARSGLELLVRRLIGISILSWLPLVLLALVERRAFHNVAIPLLFDVEIHARFLGAVPLFILAEVVAHRRVAGFARQFVDRGLVSSEDLPRFEAIKASAARLRNSIPAEIVQLALAVAVHWIWGRSMLLTGETWMSTNEGGEPRYTAAGAWYAFVSMPIFRFMWFRWYYRMFIWYRFVWQVGRLDLRLDALHPDRAGGLGFLSGSPNVFTPLLLAHSVMASGMIFTRILHQRATLPEFKVEIAWILVVAMSLALVPLSFFVTKLAMAKRKAIADYGALASRYVAEFRAKWLGGREGQQEGLVGSADIQSLADLSGAFDAIRETRLVPLTRQAFVQLLVVTALPLLLLAFTMVPYEEVLTRIAGLLF